MERPSHEPLTDKQLRDAIERADIPPRDHRIFSALVYRADWVTGEIPDRFQPRSLAVLAEWSRMSKGYVVAGLSHLEWHGWIVRLVDSPGRGHSTRYVLRIGKDCDCMWKTSRRQGMSGAERVRRHRARKASTKSVTPGSEVSTKPVTKGSTTLLHLPRSAPVFC